MVVSCRKLMIVLLVLVLSVLSASVDSPSSASPSSSASSSPLSSASSSLSSLQTQSSSASLSSSLPVDDASSSVGVKSSSATVVDTSSSSVDTSSATVAAAGPGSGSTASGRPLAEQAGSVTLASTASPSPSTSDSSSSLPQQPTSVRATKTTSSTLSSHSSSSGVSSSSSSSNTVHKSVVGRGGDSGSRGRVGDSSSSSSSTSKTNISNPARKKLPVKDQRLLKALETKLLGALGLQARPRPSKVASTVPPYMLQLYQRQTDSQSPFNAIDSPFLQAKGRGNIAANTVRSFHHTDHHATAGCDPRTCQRILFNVSNIPSSELLAAAELRIFVGLDPKREGDWSGKAAGLPCEGGQEGSGCGRSRDVPRQKQQQQQHKRQGERYRVEVHEIMQPVGGGGGGDHQEDSISRLLDTRLVEAGDAASWQAFDIQPAVLRWKRGPRHNHGLEVRLASPSQAVSASTHVRVRRAAELADEQWRVQRPLLVTYTDDGRVPKSKSLRSKRSARADRKRKRRKSRREGRTRRGRRNKKKKRRKKKRRKMKKGDKNMCRRHPLYVDFSDVGWNDWIVAPDGYNAYYCQGDCNFPLAHHLNSTNHAIVQTLVNSVDPSAVPKACCVPTELSAISMLYLDEWDKVVLKNYQDMVVEACGCR